MHGWFRCMVCGNWSAPPRYHSVQWRTSHQRGQNLGENGCFLSAVRKKKASEYSTFTFWFNGEIERDREREKEREHKRARLGFRGADTPWFPLPATKHFISISVPTICSASLISCLWDTSATQRYTCAIKRPEISFILEAPHVFFYNMIPSRQLLTEEGKSENGFLKQKRTDCETQKRNSRHHDPSAGPSDQRSPSRSRAAGCSITAAGALRKGCRSRRRHARARDGLACGVCGCDDG